MDYKYIFGAFFIATAITFFTRALPFILFSKKEMPSFLKKLIDDLPQAMIAILVIYCLKDVPSMEFIEITFLFIAVVVVVTSYLFKKNVLLSIGLGTISYMLLLFFFA